jgi:hypothetical protein
LDFARRRRRRTVKDIKGAAQDDTTQDDTTQDDTTQDDTTQDDTTQARHHPGTTPPRHDTTPTSSNQLFA